MGEIFSYFLLSIDQGLEPLIGLITVWGHVGEIFSHPPVVTEPESADMG